MGSVRGGCDACDTRAVIDRICARETSYKGGDVTSVTGGFVVVGIRPMRHQSPALGSFTDATGALGAVAISAGAGRGTATDAVALLSKRVMLQHVVSCQSQIRAQIGHEILRHPRPERGLERWKEAR
jgi:hypothetical protein